MLNNNAARSSLPVTREFAPEFGANHPVNNSRDLVNFFRRLDAEWAGVLPKYSDLDSIMFSNELGAGTEDVAEEESDNSVLSQYHLYDDPEHLSLTVVDRRLSKLYSKKRRIRWNATDAGRIKTQVDNEVARLDIVSPLEVRLARVVRLADAEGRPGDRRLGLIVEQTSREAELLVREHEIVMNGLGERLKGFRYPYETYVPSVTIGRFDQSVKPEELDDCVALTQKLLPIKVQLEPLRLFAHQEF